MNTPFKLQFIDHVALRVLDMDKSIAWYNQVLGFESWQPEEWKPFPVFMIKDEFGLALFPVQEPATKLTPHTRHFITIDHFAFRLSRPDFEVAQEHFRQLGVPFVFQDHTYFHSIYLKDPDGHTVELTMKV